MDLSLSNPIVQSSILPLCLSLLIAAALGFSSAKGARIAALGVAISALITVIIIQGFSFPPKATSQKLPYLIAAAGVIGLIFDLLKLKGIAWRLAGIILPVATIGWLFGSRLGSTQIDGFIYLSAAVLVSLFAYWQFEKSRHQLDSGIQILLYCAGLGAILMIGSSAMLSQSAFGLMAAVGGFLLLNWPKFRFPIGAALIFPLTTALAAMTAQSLFFTKASGVAIAVLIPVLLISYLLPKIPLLKKVSSPAIRAISLTAVGVVPLGASIVVAIMLTETSGLGY